MSSFRVKEPSYTSPMEIRCHECGQLQTHGDGETWTKEDKLCFCGITCLGIYREKRDTSIEQYEKFFRELKAGIPPPKTVF